MLRMDEGIWKFLIFRKMADVEIQSCLFDQNFTHIFVYKKKKKNRPKKKSFVHPEDNYISYKWEKFQTDRSSRSQVTLITDFENMVSRKTRLKFWVRFACK